MDRGPVGFAKSEGLFSGAGQQSLAQGGYDQWPHVHGLIPERRNSSALAMELHLSCTNPSMWFGHSHLVVMMSDNFNSLWPSDAFWWHRSWSTLAQVMACCMTAPSNYLNHSWLSSLRFCGIHMGLISLEILTISMYKVRKLHFWNYCHISQGPIS